MCCNFKKLVSICWVDHKRQWTQGGSLTPGSQGGLPLVAAAAAFPPSLCAQWVKLNSCVEADWFFPPFLYGGLEWGTRVHCAAHHRKCVSSHLTSEGLLITRKRHWLQTLSSKDAESRFPSFVPLLFSSAVEELLCVGEKCTELFLERSSVDCSFGKIVPFSWLTSFSPMTLSSISKEGNS